MRFSSWISFFLVWLVSTSIAWAGEDTIATKMASIKTGLAEVTSISGRFKQTKKLDFLKDPIISEGKFYFSHPDYLQWEYVNPAPSGIVIDGGKAAAWVGKKDNKQSPAMAESARLVAGQVMIWMNMDTEAIFSTFKVSLVSESPFIFMVEPKRREAQRFLQSLKVEFNKDNRSVRQVTLSEPDSTTTLAFDKIIFNDKRQKR